ncbi:hypothetical protein WMF20_12180 [Sorangium sp. So ce834]
MSHVVMQAAEFSTVAAAEQAAAELRRLVADSFPSTRSVRSGQAALA